MNDHDLNEKLEALEKAQAKLDQNRGHKQNAVSKTKQTFAHQCNINNIMAAFQKTGIMPHLKENPGLSQINPSAGLDFHQAMSLTRQRQQQNYNGSFQPDIPAKTEYNIQKGMMPFNP